MLNIGPDGKGRVPESCVKHFHELGEWVERNADAIFGTSRWNTFNENVNPKKGAHSVAGEFWFSAKGDKVYVMSLTPATKVVKVESLKRSDGKALKVRLLGGDQTLSWQQTESALEINFDGVETGVNGFAVEVTLQPKTQAEP